jgi:hypothetical protein
VAVRDRAAEDEDDDDKPAGDPVLEKALEVLRGEDKEEKKAA